jgi:spermidine synthase
VAAGDIVLRPGPAGAVLVADWSYPNAFLLRVGGTDQSYVDLDDPTRLDFDYMQRIADVVDTVAAPGQPLRVIHIGGAALTLPRYVAATRPRSSQIVLEPDVELTAFVREHLPLPRRSGIKVRPADGRTGLAELPDDHAALVVLDAFVGARVPAELTTTSFLADIGRVLLADGVAVLNITDRGALTYTRRVVAGVAALFAHVAVGAEPSTLKGRRFGNVVVVASMAGLPLEPLTRRAAASAFPYRVLAGAALTRLIGAWTPFTEEDAEPSPDPSGGKARFG